MHFRLHYRGPLHSNASSDRKFAIQRQFHPQLATLWESSGLSFIRVREWTMPGGFDRWSRKRGPLTFIPLVSEHLQNVVSLNITWLRPGLLGSLVGSNGDIDNRLKTLFDALRVPSKAPKYCFDGEPAGILYCLLDDDSLITEVSVTTDRLLEQGVEDAHVEMIIAVNIRALGDMLPQTIYAIP